MDEKIHYSWNFIKQLFIPKLPTPFWGHVGKTLWKPHGFSTIFMHTVRLEMPHTPVMFTLDRAHRLRMRAWQTLPHSASGTSRAHDPPNCRKHRIPSQLNWQEVTLRALTITKASLRPGWKKEIKGPSEPQPPTPQLTSSPVSPDQTWSSGDSLPPYLSYVMPGDIWNKLVFSPRSKKKNPHHSDICWGIYIYIYCGQ